MTYSVRIKESAAKELRDLPKNERRRIGQAIDDLKEGPFSGSLLRGVLRGLRRQRVGNYRIIYEIERSELLVYVIRISHRREAYRNLSP